jgi:ribosome biogenesis GTPase A
MTIQWFPGHMLETKKLLKTAISRVDIILEIVDARLPLTSQNPVLERIGNDKFKLKILNKTDLADPMATKEWLDYFESHLNQPAVSVSASDPKQAWAALTYGMNQIQRNRARKIKVLVVGIPNTGKSTILNSLAGKKIAKTGNVPAITRHQQRTSLKNNIDIYDTPGILWPVIEPEYKAKILAASGAISDTAIDYVDVGFFTAKFLLDRYPDLLKVRYPFLKQLPRDPSSFIEQLGRARGCLKKGGITHLQKACQALIKDVRSGKIGRISFETTKDIDHEIETR